MRRRGWGLRFRFGSWGKVVDHHFIRPRSRAARQRTQGCPVSGAEGRLGRNRPPGWSAWLRGRFIDAVIERQPALRTSKGLALLRIPAVARLANIEDHDAGPSLLLDQPNSTVTTWSVPLGTLPLPDTRARPLARLREVD